MRILLVVDFSPESEKRVAEFASRVWPPGTVVRVLAIAEKIPPSAAELWFDAEGSLNEVLQARKQQANELACKMSSLLTEKGMTVEIAVRTGKRRKETALEAKSWRPDLIVRF